MREKENSQSEEVKELRNLLDAFIVDMQAQLHAYVELNTELVACINEKGLYNSPKPKAFLADFEGGFQQMYDKMQAHIAFLKSNSEKLQA